MKRKNIYVIHIVFWCSKFEITCLYSFFFLIVISPGVPIPVEKVEGKPTDEQVGGILFE
jgi:hypothetical protein